jgi:hypothetical protein
MPTDYRIDISDGHGDGYGSGFGYHVCDGVTLDPRHEEMFVPNLRLDELLAPLESQSTKNPNRPGKLERIIRSLPEDLQETVRLQISERDTSGNWVRPHAAVASAFQQSGHPDVVRSTVETYRSRLPRD